MSRTLNPSGRNTFNSESTYTNPRHIPILPSSSTSASFPQTDAMEITPPTSASFVPPHNTSSPETAENHKLKVGNSNGDNLNGGSGVSAAAAASGSTPKVVQTAFIHKLYNMLEDQTIRHLISWADSNESFVMSPSPEFSKVLAQYFKHTNISSFVRQLNMYGFHKVSDVFHTGQPDSALWEFKHGNGNFKRGDLAGLREIKRRASRHVLNVRDSFALPHKPSISQPGTPSEAVPELPPDVRLANVEASLYEVQTRLMRTEENNTALSTRCAVLSESLSKYHHWTLDLAQIINKLIPEHDSALLSQVSSIHKQMAQHVEMLQRPDEGHDPLLSSRPYFSNLSIEAGSLSPRQRAQDERRGSYQTLPAKPGFFRAPAPPHLAISPRRFGSIGTQGHSPSYRTPVVPPQPILPPAPHPLTAVEPSPSLARRHTSADIRDTAGWPPQPGASPFDPPTSSTANWPPSPQPPLPQGDVSIQSVLAQYTMGGSRMQSTSGVPSRQGSPPPEQNDNGFSFKTPNYGSRLMDSAPPTRRGSMAHILNPTDGGEPETDEGNDDRKRRRL